MIGLRTMRWLDHTLGSALCFGLARMGIGRRQEGAGGKAASPVLFIGLAEMGSTILADPAMRQARDTHGASLHFAIFHQNRSSLDLTGTIRPENTFHLRTHSLLTLAVDTLRFMSWSRRRGIATAIDIDPCSNFSAILALLSGASIRAGFRHASGQQAGRAMLFNRGALYRQELHLTQNLIALTDAALGTEPGKHPAPIGALPAAIQRKIPPAERQKIHTRLRFLAPDFDPARHRILLVNPNVGDLLPQRRWPRQNYARLVTGMLARHLDLFVFLLGSLADAESVAALEMDVGDRRCRAIAGAFALAELPALFASSALLVSSDSGPAHFAAVTSLPVVVLFGPETPLRYRPLGNATSLVAGLECSPCIGPDNRRQTDCRDNRCMRAIGVETVMMEIERRLGEAGLPGRAYEAADEKGSASPPETATG